MSTFGMTKPCVKVGAEPFTISERVVAQYLQSSTFQRPGAINETGRLVSVLCLSE